MTELSVNVNRIALLRNTRNIGIPNVVKMAEIALAAGAYGITVHPRPDQRHITPQDVFDLAELITDAEFNIEGNPFPEFMDLVRKVKPNQCTLVPDDRDVLTSDKGWDLINHGSRLVDIIKELHDLGCRVSLFMDLEKDQIEKAKELDADRVELRTEPYARAFSEGNVEEVFEEFKSTALFAQEIGLGVNGGHDLNLQNLGKFISIPNILEVSIGHALISESIEFGLAETIKRYIAILKK